MDNLSNQRTLGTESATKTGFWNVAYPLQIRWKQADQASSRTTSASKGSATSSTTAPVFPGGVITNQSSPPPTKSSNSLGIGLGVGLGIGLGLIGLSIVIATAIWVRRRQRVKEHGADMPQSDQVYPKPELDAVAAAPHGAYDITHSGTVPQGNWAPFNQRPAELDSPNYGHDTS
ncbi:hypothetical protein FGG08_003983 [Glutinoglossum americanum]|uniref:Mid2 domain-containing protein n=1 Tax=Glutinoglossum americanum TaxID=1670608 RepID=A0A9P8I3A0_9PEZI|nr:hypothetical protein FGG08_003983 [Glutinoglossum americanum]